MSDFDATFPLWSPRQGMADDYRVVFTRNELRVAKLNFSATCRRSENGDPVWSGYEADGGNPLMNIFENDQVYAPSIVPIALEMAWRKWLDDEALDSTVHEGLAELFSWIDQTARSTPKQSLWNGIL